MNANARLLFFGLLTVVFAGSGCASTSAPNNWESTAETMQREAYGGWVDITLKSTSNDPSMVQGELIAVNHDSLHVLQTTGTLTSVAFPSVEEVKLGMFDANASTLGFLSLGGTVSTISHGYWLLYSFPLWVITGTTFTILQARQSTVTDLDREVLRRYARFPQGLPSEVQRHALTGKTSGDQEREPSEQ